VWGDRVFVLTAVKTDRTAEEAKDTAASGLAPTFQLVSDKTSTQLLAQRDEAPEGNQKGEGRRDGARRGRGGFGPGGGQGFGRGGFGRGEKPTNIHQFVVLCIDRNTGKTLWQKIANETVPHEGHHQTGSFASASPITDGKRLIASFGSRGIYCFDLDGNQKWGRDLEDLQMRMAFGEGSSPALYEDTLVLTCDQVDDSFIVALDANTGDEKWRKPREEVSTWATPLIVNDGQRLQVITSGSTRVRSYDLENGDVIWECGGLGSNPIACPVVYDGLAIIMSGHHDPAGIAVPLTSRGDVTGTDNIAWQIEEVTPYVSTPLLYDDTLYFVKSRNAILSSANAKTGEPIIRQKRLPEMESIYASPVGADGRVYLSSREGTTLVFKHGPEFEILATNILDEPIDASPAIVGNDLIIRGENHLYCISEE
jgi:outer membrane protein assembly factor BamB